MTPNPQAWLPTTKAQSVLVYGLNALLLFNLTVIVVLLAGTGSPSSEGDAAPRKAINASSQPVLLPLMGSSEPLVDSIPAAQPTQPTQASRVSSEPLLLSAPDEQGTTGLSSQAVVQPQPQTEASTDPPVTFFGIGLDVD